MFNYWRTIILNQSIGYTEVKNFLDSKQASFRYYPNTNPKHLEKCKGIRKDLNDMEIPVVYMGLYLNDRTDFTKTRWRVYEQTDGKHLYFQNDYLDLRIKMPIRKSKTLVLERMSMITKSNFYDACTGEPVSLSYK